MLMTDVLSHPQAMLIHFFFSEYTFWKHFTCTCLVPDCSLPVSSVHGFARQGYWSGLLFPSLVELPDPGIEPRSPALHTDSLPSELQGSPVKCSVNPQLETKLSLEQYPSPSKLLICGKYVLVSLFLNKFHWIKKVKWEIESDAGSSNPMLCDNLGGWVG